MHNFAHEGVSHATTPETLGHALPIVAALTVIAIFLLLVAAWVLSQPNERHTHKPNKEEE